MFSLFQHCFSIHSSYACLTQQVVSGIKVIKLYAWELSFKRLINAIRLKELQLLRTKSLYVALINFVSGSMSFLAASFSFLAYLLADSSRVLDASTAFVSLTLFNLIKQPLLILPNLLSGLVMVRCIVNYRVINYFHKCGYPLLRYWLPWSPSEMSIFQKKQFNYNLIMTTNFVIGITLLQITLFKVIYITKYSLPITYL